MFKFQTQAQRQGAEQGITNIRLICKKKKKKSTGGRSEERNIVNRQVRAFLTLTIVNNKTFYLFGIWM